MEEHPAYLRGFSTGFSAGARSVREPLIQDCRIFPFKPRNIQTPSLDNVYAMDFWLMNRIRNHPYRTKNITNATLITARYKDSDDVKKLVSHSPEIKVVIIDFHNGCRHRHAPFHYIRLENSFCKSRNGYDLVAPHTTTRVDVPTKNARKTLVSFWGRIPKPYINPPLSQVRYLLWKTLRNQPDCDVGAYGVETTVNAYTTNDTTKWCRWCSYACKKCYFEKEVPKYINSPRLTREKFHEKMKQSIFCIVARGDDPGCPKLGEAVLNGCIPVIVMDQRLPFESQIDYRTFSVRFDVEDVLSDPGRVLRSLRNFDESNVRFLQTGLLKAASFFDFHLTSRFSAQDAIIHDMCNLPLPPARV